MQLVSSSAHQDDLIAAMRQFIIDQGEGRSPETQQRYRQVADDLVMFVGSVDVRPWLGQEIAAHLEQERQRLGSEALPTSLGLMSLIRVLPAFLADPWLPAPSQQRRTHRAAVRALKTFLRLRAALDDCLRKEDFQAIDKALRNAYYADSRHPLIGRTGTVRCAVTLDLVEHFVDRLLEEVAQGKHETLDEAVAARLNPVQVTVWREPGHDRYDW